MKPKTILIIIGTIGLLSLLFHGNNSFGANPEYPTKPITYYISYPAGGATDILIRALIEPTGKHLGQPFVVINKPGGGALLGAVAVLNSKPDGYTLGSFAGTQALIAPHTGECPYKDIGGFTFVTNYGKWVYPAMVRGDAPYKTWKEFIEWARKNPRDAKVSIPGSKAQTPQGIAMAGAEQREGVEFTYITSKGGPEQSTFLLGGHTTLAATVMDATLIQYINEGKLRCLAYLGREKVPGYEAIPSFYELYGIEAIGYVGIWGPKGIPDYALDKLEDAFARALKDPNFVGVMKRMSLPVVYMNRQQLDKEMKEAFPKMGQAVKALMAEEAKEKK